MTRLLVGMLIGAALSAPTVDAFRALQPPTITEWTPNSFADLNTFLNQLWNITNGRYSKEIVTTNPNGSRRGDPGDAILYNTGGNYQECHNVSTTLGGTTWLCESSALTTP